MSSWTAWAIGVWGARRQDASSIGLHAILDELARLGMNGLYHSTFQGLARPGKTAHFCMFGYDIDNLPGRGVLEAVGEGIHISKGADDAVDRPYIHPSPKPLRIG